MADLRTGMNYVPGESILDPYYCPPEQYVLPTDTPDLANTNRVMSLAMSTMLWNRHKPDRFDSYSIGLILMQLAVPQLRMKSGLEVCAASVCLSSVCTQQSILASIPAGPRTGNTLLAVRNWLHVLVMQWTF